MFGSVFLGDPRQRLIASTSPATSSSAHGAPHIPPEVALQLRIRWLEVLLLGVNDPDKRTQKAKESTTATPKTRKKKINEEEDEEEEETDETEEELTDEQTLIRRAEEVQRKLDVIVMKNDDISRFVETYDKNAHLFTPAFALSYQNPSTAPMYSALSPSDLDALLQEMEPDIREADRSLSSISQLEKLGVTGAGKLEEYEPLMPRMSEVWKRHKEDVARLDVLEGRVMNILESYGERMDLMTKLFVEWNELVGEAEAAITKLEKEKEEKQKLGLR